MSTPVTEDEIKNACHFFQNNPESLLASMATTFNTEQPMFTTVIFGLNKNGSDMEKLEEILLSLFVVYFVHRIIREKSVKAISAGAIKKNVESFTSFLGLWNKEHKSDDSMDLKSLNYLSDTEVTKYATLILDTTYGKITDAPVDVIALYFSVLKAIEKSVSR